MTESWTPGPLDIAAVAGTYALVLGPAAASIHSRLQRRRRASPRPDKPMERLLALEGGSPASTVREHRASRKPALSPADTGTLYVTRAEASGAGRYTKPQRP